MNHSTYTTFNNSAEVFVAFGSVSHLINDKGEGCWVWFHSGKCIHVKETFEDVSADLADYLETLK